MSDWEIESNDFWKGSDIVDSNKEFADNYEIKQSVSIGRKRFVLGEDLTAILPYLLADATEYFCGYRYDNCVASTNYLDLYKQFIERQTQELENIRDELKARGSDTIPYDASVCIPNSSSMDYTNKILVLKPSFLRAEFRVKDEQLVLAQNGFGCAPNGNGTKVFCQDCRSGERFYVHRQDVLGIMAPEHIPEWASKNAELYRKSKPRSAER